LDRRVAKSAGFTLIELVVVVGILVALAGIVLPKLDIYQLKANKGIAAANIGGVSRYVQTFRITHNVYPDNFDSLLTNTGVLWAPGAPGTTPGIDPQLVGGPPAGSPTKLTTTTIVGDELRSLTRMGITTILDVDPTTGGGIPGDRFDIPRTLAAGEIVATLNSGPGGDDDANGIVDRFYPQGGGVPAGKKIVVFGFGPRNLCIGDVLQEAPFYSNTDARQYYNRFLCCFEVDSGGSRARFLGALGADADRMDEEINDYFE